MARTPPLSSVGLLRDRRWASGAHVTQSRKWSYKREGAICSTPQSAIPKNWDGVSPMWSTDGMQWLDCTPVTQLLPATTSFPADSGKPVVPARCAAQRTADLHGGLQLEELQGTPGPDGLLDGVAATPDPRDGHVTALLVRWPMATPAACAKLGGYVKHRTAPLGANCMKIAMNRCFQV